MRIKHKLGISHGTMAIALIAQLVLSYYGLVFVRGVLEDNVQDKMSSLLLISQISDRLGVIRSEEVDLSLERDFYAIEGHVSKIQTEVEGVSGLIENMLNTKIISETEESRNKLQFAWNAYSESLEKTISLMNEGDGNGAIQNQKSSSTPRFNVLKVSLSQTMDLISERTQASYGYTIKFVQNQSILLLILSIFGAGVSFLFAFVISRSLTKRIALLREGTQKMETGNATAIEVSGRDELSEFASYFNKTSSKVISLLKTIEEHNRTLEEKVKIRTRHLKAILDSMKQGVFTLNADGRIDSYYSKYLETLIESEDVSGKQISDAVLCRTDLSPDTISMLNSLVHVSIGEDDLNFSLNEHQFPKELFFDSKQGDKKKFEVQWDPIMTDEDVVDKILVTLRDITELEKLREDNKRNEQEIRTIVEIISLASGKFHEFITSAFEFINESIEANQSIESDGAEIEAANQLILRNLHTIKGNGRTLGLAGIVDVVHHVEEDLIKATKNGGERDGEFYGNRLNQVKDSLEIYQRVYETKILVHSDGDEGKSGELYMLSAEFIQEVEGKLELLAERERSISLSVEFEKFRHKFFRLAGVPFAAVVEDESSSIAEIAGTLNKEAPEIELLGEDLVLKKDFKIKIKSILAHILKNSIFHGLETVEERRKNAKPDRGRITIESSCKGSFVELSIFDDGRGLNLGALRKKYGGDLSDDLLAEQIFVSGSSTVEQANDVAGRGVGMDAVRSFIQELGGTIQIEFTGPSQESGFRSFRQKIVIPTEMFFIEQKPQQMDIGA